MHGPANEAVLMRTELLRLGVPEERILVEPCARHTTTNLRNAGRLMLAHGLRDAWVVCPDADGEGWIDRLRGLGLQASYIGHPARSTFALRCRVRLGYAVGTLRWVRPWHVHFVPSPACFGTSPHPTSEGDP